MLTRALITPACSLVPLSVNRLMSTRFTANRALSSSSKGTLFSTAGPEGIKPSQRSIRFSSALTSAPAKTVNRYLKELDDPAEATRKMRCLRIDKNGVSTFKELSRDELAKIYKLPRRDLRLLAQLLRKRVPAILPRESAIVVVMSQSFRAIIDVDHVLVFQPDMKEVQPLIAALQDRIRDWSKEAVVDILRNPFELVALESILINLADWTRHRAIQLERQIQAISNAFTSNTSLHQLLGLSSADVTSGAPSLSPQSVLSLKDQLNDLETSSSECARTLENLAANDQDLGECFLSYKVFNKGTRVPTNKHDELEIMIETYTNELLETNHLIAACQLRLKSIEQRLALELDRVRNEIAFMDLWMSIGTVSLSSGALITSMWGMNLLNGYEHHPHAFAFVAGGALVMSASILLILRSLARKNNMPWSFPSFRIRKQKQINSQSQQSSSIPPPPPMEPKKPHTH